jgi:hypothetical protein
MRAPRVRVEVQSVLAYEQSVMYLPPPPQPAGTDVESQCRGKALNLTGNSKVGLIILTIDNLFLASNIYLRMSASHYTVSGTKKEEEYAKVCVDLTE